MAQQGDDSKEAEVVISDAERAEFNDAFKLFDKDGDGVITVDEIHEVITQLRMKNPRGNAWSKSDIKKMVKAVDVDGNGSIDLDEFIQLLRSKRNGKFAKLTPDQELKEAFKIFDADKNGSIDADELAIVMKALGEKLSKTEIEFMIKSVDLDGDKSIDFDEFKKLMQMKPIPQDTMSTLGH